MARQQTTLIRRQIIRDLEWLGAWLYHSSPTGSQYVKFDDNSIGSVRIADHKGRPRYRYRWNLIFGGHTRVEEDRGVVRYYYNLDEAGALQQFYSDIKEFAAELGWIENE